MALAKQEYSSEIAWNYDETLRLQKEPENETT